MLDWAAFFSPQCVEELAKYEGLDWNCLTNTNSTPLHKAIGAGKSVSTKLIIDIPTLIDFTVQDNDGYTAAQLAAMSTFNKYDIECLKNLVNVDAADFNVTDSKGDTPLMWTLKNNKMDRFNVLVNCPRVDLNSKDKQGDTVALWALKNNNFDALETILTKPGVDVTIEDSNGDTLKKIAK